VAGPGAVHGRTWTVPMRLRLMVTMMTMMAGSAKRHSTLSWEGAIACPIFCPRSSWPDFGADSARRTTSNDGREAATRLEGRDPQQLPGWPLSSRSESVDGSGACALTAKPWETTGVTRRDGLSGAI